MTIDTLQAVPDSATAPSAASPPAADSTKSATISARSGYNCTAYGCDTRLGNVTDAVARANAIDSNRAAWLLGSRLSLAALANDRHVAANNVPIWFEDAKTAAKLLGTTVTDLPEPAAADDTSLASQQVINYLAREWPADRSRAGEAAWPRAVGLVRSRAEVQYPAAAVHARIVGRESIAAAISRAAPQAKLPDELWKPLVERIGQTGTAGRRAGGRAEDARRRRSISGRTSGAAAADEFSGKHASGVAPLDVRHCPGWQPVAVGGAAVARARLAGLDRPRSVAAARAGRRAAGPPAVSAQFIWPDSCSGC